MKRIKVNIPDNQYDVVLGENAIYSLYNEIERLGLSTNIFGVIDKNVFELHKTALFDAFKSFVSESKYIVIDSTEQNKSLETIQAIYEHLLKEKFSRDGLILAVGGGIVGDVAGFAAASYMRGIPYIQVPSTLLAAVDSSVGGKTGVNFNQRKNIIGAFHQPQLVVADTKFYKSLDRKEILCGMGEVIKYAYLSNEKFYNKVKDNIENILALHSGALSEIIEESINIKAGVVKQDEKESGLRKILNLGHTFSHAIESRRNYGIKHGKAVVVGITAALYLSNELNILPDEKLTQLLSLINKVEKYIEIDEPEPERIYEIMFSDKKNRDGKIKFVLIKGIGEILIDVEAEQELVLRAVEKAGEHFV